MFNALERKKDAELKFWIFSTWFIFLKDIFQHTVATVLSPLPVCRVKICNTMGVGHTSTRGQISTDVLKSVAFPRVTRLWEHWLKVVCPVVLTVLLMHLCWNGSGYGSGLAFFSLFRLRMIIHSVTIWKLVRLKRIALDAKMLEWRNKVRSLPSAREKKRDA